MQEKHLFEYAVIRIVPRVEREEFLNAGVVLYCKPQKFLKAIFLFDEKRINAFCSTMDTAIVHEYLLSLQRICEGADNAGPIAKLDPASRFRWLTAMRSTMVQTSRVHPGLCDDPDKVLLKLYHELVL